LTTPGNLVPFIPLPTTPPKIAVANDSTSKFPNFIFHYAYIPDFLFFGWFPRCSLVWGFFFEVVWIGISGLAAWGIVHHNIE
jgi:hypothetical protein